MKQPKILSIDIETSPLEARIWALGDQFVGHEQIVKDWSILAVCAKWYGTSNTTYLDTRNKFDIRNDKELVGKVWQLLDEADIVLTQNGNKFDLKKLNARFIKYDMPPPSSYQKLDMLVESRKVAAMTSHSLKYVSEYLDLQSKKDDHKKFPGMKLWDECLAKNPEAWREMQKYNVQDVLALESYFDKLKPWIKSVNFNVYHEGEEHVCKCGSTELQRNGYFYSATGKYQRYKCKACGAESRDRTNLLSKEKMKSMKVGTR